jgi:phenylalanyl-tRNA synthetase beta chain
MRGQNPIFLLAGALSGTRSMIVSWNWLKDYLALDMPVEEFELRLMMAGLNHESTHKLANDLAIDLEVTSNRPDCLGHLGIAREAAVLFDLELKLPSAAPREGNLPVADGLAVRIDCPELCSRYTARVIRGVKIGSSPRWLAERLQTIGIAQINNIVDITNYVLMECGQPLHAFDLAKLAGQQIVVRQAQQGEPFTAIDHRSYELQAGMCVVADANRPAALGGVMGGAESEVSPATKNILLEAAEFSPLSIRNTARQLNLHSPSSYRFERGLDPAGIDWASRRACELILELAGGELDAGVVDVGAVVSARRPVTLRLAQLKRILGIDIPPAEVARILAALGCEHSQQTSETITITPPSWRRDLTREIDLIEEAARIHGYDKIPEDVGVPMAASMRTVSDRVFDSVRRVMTSAGFDEAMTISAVEDPWAMAFSPWSALEPLRTATPVLRRADRLRTSVVPSLLGVRKANEAIANPIIELFEIASIYLPSPGQLPDEQRVLSCTSGEDFHAMKGVLETLIATLAPALKLEAVATRQPLLDAARSAELRLNGEVLGYLGEVSRTGLKQFELRGRTTVAELRLDVLLAAAVLVPRCAPLSPFPAVSRDLNIELADPVRWAEVERIVQASAGEHLESIAFQETYRDPQHVSAGSKRLLFTIVLRSKSGTLTREEADAVRDGIVSQLSQALGGKLVA